MQTPAKEAGAEEAVKADLTEETIMVSVAEDAKAALAADSEAEIADLVKNMKQHAQNAERNALFRLNQAETNQFIAAIVFKKENQKDTDSICS